MQTHESSFGDYTLLRQINRGATAVVYEAEETSLAWQASNPHIALKVFNERPGGGFTIPVSTIQQEIKCASSLHHNNIAQLLDVIPCGDRLGLVFELVQGPDLLDYIKRSRGRMSEELAMHYFRQLVSAVGHCHSQQIVHRDLKPENCMVDPETHTLKLIDFGLATATSDPCLTGCGTINTIAPECIAVDGLPSTIKDPKAVDVWGLGVTLYIMLSGSYPFQDHQRPHCDESHKRNILRGRIHALPSGISSTTKSLVRKILQVDPDRRLTLEQVLDHPALKMESPAETVFADERQMFSFIEGMGSRVSSYASQASDVSPERLRPSPPLPWLMSDSSCDMDFESSPPADSPSPPSDRRQSHHLSSQSLASSSLKSLPATPGNRSSLFSARGCNSMASISSWDLPLQKPTLLSSSLDSSQIWGETSTACTSMAASPVPSRKSLGSRPSSSAYATGTEETASFTSQIARIQAALQEESDRDLLEAGQTSRSLQFGVDDLEDTDAELGSEFDIGDKAQIGYPATQLSLHIPPRASTDVKSDDSVELAHSLDSCCSLPWSPKDAADRPSPVKLFSVSATEEASPSSQPSSSGQGLLKATPSFQQLSTFKSYLSDIPEGDEFMEESLEKQDTDMGQVLSTISLSMRSDTTTYEAS